MEPLEFMYIYIDVLTVFFLLRVVMQRKWRALHFGLNILLTYKEVQKLRYFWCLSQFHTRCRLLLLQLIAQHHRMLTPLSQDVWPPTLPAKYFLIRLARAHSSQPICSSLTLLAKTSIFLRLWDRMPLQKQPQ